MPSGGGSAERVTFTGNYNISPAISPRRPHHGYITRQSGAFRLSVMDLATGQAQQISESSDDESPSFAPNGRLIAYATRAGGKEVLMTTTLDGKNKGAAAGHRRTGAASRPGGRLAAEACAFLVPASPSLELPLHGCAHQLLDNPRPAPFACPAF